VKRPSFQFYPADWLQDTALRACSLAARGLWADMMCFMHQGTPYGHLTLPTSKDAPKDMVRPILPPVLARMVGCDREECEALLRELEEAGVFSRTFEGVIFSRRMVRDEEVRGVRAAGGYESLNNPNVPRPKTDGWTSLRGSLDMSLGGSPSSSSSSSSSPASSSEPSGSPHARKIRSQGLVSPSPVGINLANLLRAGILANNPNAKITAAQMTTWALEADRMISLDNRSESQIAELIAWSQNDPFWRSNILSMGKLRKQFDQLTVKRSSENRPNHNGQEYPQGLIRSHPPPIVPASRHMRKMIAEERELAAKTAIGVNP
jgi:hypothetical protein